MEHCTGCGGVLGHSRYCTHCGRAVVEPDDWRTGTAERPVVPPDGAEPDPVSVTRTSSALPPAVPPPAVPPPAVPPPAVPPPAVPPPAVLPTAARYPLFADEVGAAAPPAEPSPTTIVPLSQPDPVVPSAVDDGDRRHRSPVPWVLGVVALLLMAVVGGLLLMTGGDADDGRATDPSGGAAVSDSAGPTDGGEGAAAQPAPKASAPLKRKPPKRQRPAQITRSLDVTVPATAPPNQDVKGNQVRYGATNLIDGVPTTCWRMPGSGAGEEIVLRLAEPTKVAQVGLINGYAKSSGDLDWYRGNRRVLAVEWVFDDGTKVSQSLAQTRALQTVAVKPVRTSTIRLRLLEVSAPGKGRAARNYTALSDVSVTGTPA